MIASHSGVRALANVSRNMDDEQLLALKKNGGVIQVVGFSSYVKTDSKERVEALAKLREEFGIAAAGAGRGGRGGGAGGGGRGAAADSVRTCSVEVPGAPPAQGRRGGAAAGGGVPRSMPSRPIVARSTKSGWPKSTPSCRRRAAPT